MVQSSLFENVRVFQSNAAVTPRDYQARGIDRAFELYAEGARGMIYRQPTGTGKTVSGTLIAERWLNMGDDNRVMILAHERQLVQQFAEEVEDLLGEKPGVEMSTDGRVSGLHIPPIVVASRATFKEVKRARDGIHYTDTRLSKFDPVKYNWLLLIDEAHRWAYKLASCAHILQWFEKNPHSWRVGLTATPERGDKVSLSKVFPEIASDYRLYDIDGGPCAVNDGWAVPYDQRFITVEGVDFKNIGTFGKEGDFKPEELDSLLSEHETLLKLVRPMLDLVGDRRTIIFSPTVEMAKKVAITINAETQDWKAALSLDGSYPDVERKDVYRRHKRGDFQYLSVCNLCREGYNDPGIGAVAVFRPTKSRGLAEQMKGRGCRPLRGVVDGLDTPEERLAAIAASDKPNCMIVDLVGITGMADCASTAHILASGKSDEIIDRANKNASDKPPGSKVDMAEEVRKAERELKKEQEERDRKEAERRSKIKADVRYSEQRVDSGHGSRNVQQKSGARMPFGKHKGQLIADINTGYLRWAFEDSNLREGWVKGAIKKELTVRGVIVAAPKFVERPTTNRFQKPATTTPAPSVPKQRTLEEINKMLAEVDVDECPF